MQCQDSLCRKQTNELKKYYVVGGTVYLKLCAECFAERMRYQFAEARKKLSFLQ